MFIPETYILSGKLRTITAAALNGMADHYDIRNRVFLFYVILFYF